MTVSDNSSVRGARSRDGGLTAHDRFNPATIAIGGVALAALVALIILFLTEPSQAGRPLAAGAGVDTDQVQVATLNLPGKVSGAGGKISAKAPARIVKTLKIRSGDTLVKVLTKAGARTGEGYAAANALAKVFNTRRLQIGQEVTVTFVKESTGNTGTGKSRPRLAALRIMEGVDREVTVERDDQGGYAARQTVYELDRGRVRATGTIDLSLSEAAANAKLSANIIADLIRIFSYDVDFEREIQRGDRFEIFYERYFDSTGRAVKDGNILYAALTLSGQKLAYYRYVPKGGSFADYFDAKGQSARKSLMRTPIDGARLTSRYGKRRHPVLGYTRMHRGVDFGARKGTPIMAAGDGVIVKAGWNGSYGKYIRIRHNNSYSTAYAHMSALAKGMKRGRRVRQGQVIGYVGRTGRVTGAHLHYEVMKNNRQVNPLGVKVPTGQKLHGKELARFTTQVAKLQTQMAALPPVTRQVAAFPATAGDTKSR